MIHTTNIYAVKRATRSEGYTLNVPYAYSCPDLDRLWSESCKDHAAMIRLPMQGFSRQPDRILRRCWSPGPSYDITSRMVHSSWLYDVRIMWTFSRSFMTWPLDAPIHLDTGYIAKIMQLCRWMWISFWHPELPLYMTLLHGVSFYFVLIGSSYSTPSFAMDSFHWANHNDRETWSPKTDGYKHWI